MPREKHVRLARRRGGGEVTSRGRTRSAASAPAAVSALPPRTGATSRTSNRDASVLSRWKLRRCPPESSGHGGSLVTARIDGRPLRSSVLRFALRGSAR